MPQPSSKDYLKQIEKWWKSAKIDPEHRAEVLSIAKSIIANKARYLTVALATKVPWFLIACIHQKECSLSFLKVLHNGELLSNVNRHGTTIVPIGRGKGLNWTWELAAIDALRYDKLHLKDLSSVVKIIDAAERYNGLGSRSRDQESVYIWSHTTVSDEVGMYVSDGKWSSTARSKNPGVAAILIALRELGEDIPELAA